jgi:allantoin racemase
MGLAASLGRRFAIVTVWPRAMNFIFHERIESCRMAARCAGVWNVLSDPEMALVESAGADDPVMAMRAGSAAMIDRIVAAAERAIDEDDVDTISLGCTCMAPIAHLVAARMSVPVIEPMAAGYKMAETLLSLGLAQSPVAYPRADPARLDRLERLISGAAAQPTEEACEVCEFTPDRAAE